MTPARVLTLGFLAATAWLVLPDDREAAAPTEAAAPAAATEPSSKVTIVDVATATITPELLSLNLRLGPGERIEELDDVPATTFGAGVQLGLRALTSGPRQYADLTIMGPAGRRRILVLFH